MRQLNQRVAVSITEGRSVRDLFYNGLLDYFNDAGFTVTVFTEAIAVPRFIEEWQRPGVEFAPLLPCEATSARSRAFWMRRRVARLGSPWLLQAWLAFEWHRYYPLRPEYIERFRRERPALLLTTHSHLHREGELLRAAHSVGVPTLGVVRSWDNVYKGIRSRPGCLAVWNEINREEVIRLEGYSPDAVEITGPSQFDLYFASGGEWTRERLASHFNLEPARPIILFASPGYFHGIDETVWMDDLVRLLESDALEGRPQIICRLHPWSRLEHFLPYAAHRDVRLSYVERYWPALSWYMTREDILLVGNILRHADAVVTPASTITLEAAIFDRPTVVSTYHTYQPEQAGEFYGRAFGMHFKRIRELDLVPVVERAEDFAGAINRCLREPGWYREQRARMVRDYVTYTDGSSTQRLFELAVRLATGAEPRRNEDGHRATATGRVARVSK
jgi:CDP-Glycerol:Poly(glycerophosphate) glycerophosphotransferase